MVAVNAAAYTLQFHEEEIRMTQTSQPRRAALVIGASYGIGAEIARRC